MELPNYSLLSKCSGELNFFFVVVVIYIYLSLYLYISQDQ